MAKSVLIATRMPLLFRTYALSSEASAALVPQTGVFAASTKASHASSDYHHPEEPAAVSAESQIPAVISTYPS
jgi:hypothetical protein